MTTRQHGYITHAEVIWRGSMSSVFQDSDGGRDPATFGPAPPRARESMENQLSNQNTTVLRCNGNQY